MSVSVPPSLKKSHLVLPGRPRLVLYTITPFAASVPYSTAADGPLTTSIDSMSSGLMSLRREGTCPPTPTEFELAPFSTRMPSTTITGSFESVTLFAPRIRIRAPVPVVPPDGCTSNPGVRPVNWSAALVTGDSDITLAASIFATALPCSRIVCSPVAVTTTASSPTTLSARATSAAAVWPACTVTCFTPGAYPITRTRSSTLPAET